MTTRPILNRLSAALGAALLIALVAAPSSRPVRAEGEARPDPGGVRSKEGLEHLRLRSADLPAGWVLLPGTDPLPGEADFRKRIEPRALASEPPGGPPPRAIVGVDRVRDADGTFPILFFSFAEQNKANAAAGRLRSTAEQEPPIAWTQALNVVFVAPARRGGFHRQIKPMVAARVGQEARERALRAIEEKRWSDAADVFHDLTWAKPEAQLLTLYTGAQVRLARYGPGAETAARARAATDYGNLPPDLRADLDHFDVQARAGLGRLEEAASLAGEAAERAARLGAAPKARSRYDAASVAARRGDKKKALAEIRAACETARPAGESEWCEGAAGDAAFGALREDPEFRKIVGAK